jgi:hypothetical protein
MATRRGPNLTVRVAVTGVKNTVPWANVHWCQLTTGSTIIQADLDTWTSAFGTAQGSNIGPQQAPSVTYSLATATLFQPDGSILRSVRTVSATGSEAGTEMNDNGPAWVISWLSSVYWRGGKPRSYIPGVMQGDATAPGILTAGAVNTKTTAALAFRTAVNALTAGTITGTQLGFVSFRSGNADRVPPIFYPFTGAKVHPRLGNQRRRQGPWQP